MDDSDGQVAGVSRPSLQVRATSDSEVRDLGGDHWRLGLGPGDGGSYRLAQMDDYWHRPRRSLPWRPGLRLILWARAGGQDVPGTWGFGFWNDPFGLALGLRGSARRLPTLPQCVWFFHASPPSYLALRDDHPARGLLTATFVSRRLPSVVLLPTVLCLPMLWWRPSARWMRRAARGLLKEDAGAVAVEQTAWHHYVLEWLPGRARFLVDWQLCFETDGAPEGPLGLVIWIDNQYASFTPDGRLRLGTLPTGDSSWMEVREVQGGMEKARLRLRQCVFDTPIRETYNPQDYAGGSIGGCDRGDAADPTVGGRSPVLPLFLCRGPAYEGRRWLGRPAAHLTLSNEEGRQSCTV